MFSDLLFVRGNGSAIEDQGRPFLEPIGLFNGAQVIPPNVCVRSRKFAFLPENGKSQRRSLDVYILSLEDGTILDRDSNPRRMDAYPDRLQAAPFTNTQRLIGSAGDLNVANQHLRPRYIDSVVAGTVKPRILDHAASLVSPGGILVYSTCSIIREENDQVVEEFLLRHKEFQLESAKKFWDKRIVSERGFLKTYPNIFGLDGAFAARLKLRPN
ncbi:MAG: hypothetical protein IID49_07760 [Proteobacteria bacterium]|nr:hypothetical protein [Pseudomonadota bacterium]